MLSTTRKTRIYSYSIENLCPEQITAAETYEADFKQKASGNTIFGYVHAARLAHDGNHVFDAIVNSFRQSSVNLINEELRNLDNAISAINIEVEKGKPDRDFENIDMIIAGAFLAILIIPLVVQLPTSFAEFTVADWLIVGFAPFVFTPVGFVVLALPAMLVHIVRKFLWAERESDANLKKQKLQQKISELKTVRDKILEFTAQYNTVVPKSIR